MDLQLDATVLNPSEEFEHLEYRTVLCYDLAYCTVLYHAPRLGGNLARTRLGITSLET